LDGPTVRTASLDEDLGAAGSEKGEVVTGVKVSDKKRW
jgi:hypothetical protein